jgi:lipoyl(octanoyl) transferase
VASTITEISPIFEIENLLSRGLISYDEGLELQNQRHQSVVSDQSPSTMILLEHESVYTAGKRTEPHERPLPGFRVVDVNRGGKITWHGPGQIVGYPIIKLANPHELLGYVRTIEAALIATLEHFSIVGKCIKGRSGVWIDGERKIAAIGIRVAQGVTMHGFALNVDCDLAHYDQIIPCGIADAGVTSMAKELQIKNRLIAIQDVLPILQEQMQRHLLPLVDFARGNERFQGAP